MHMKIAKRQRFINLTLSPDHNFFPFFSFFLFKILKKKKPQIFKFIFLLTFFVEEISLQFLSVVGAVDSLQTVVFFFIAFLTFNLSIISVFSQGSAIGLGFQSQLYRWSHVSGTNFGWVGRSEAGRLERSILVCSIRRCNLAFSICMLFLMDLMCVVVA